MSIVEEAGTFKRNIDHVECLSLTVTVYTKKYRMFSHDHIKESSHQTLAVKHDGFIDHWEEGYSYQRLKLYDYNQF